MLTDLPAAAVSTPGSGMPLMPLRPLRVLHLAAGDLASGAARGALGLHRGLRQLGVASTLLSDSRHVPEEAGLVPLLPSAPRWLGHALRRRLAEAPTWPYTHRRREIFSTGRYGARWWLHPAAQQADIVHLHWINGLVALDSLPQLKQPVVWTLRDMWPFTGGCHVALECTRYEQGCGQCPQLGSQAAADLSSATLSLKQRCLPSTLQVVAPSTWMADCARRSAVLRGREIRTIPNGVDTQCFAPMPSAQARVALGLPLDKRVVLIGAQNAGDPWKGFELAAAALAQLQTADAQVVVFGQGAAAWMKTLRHAHTDLGYLHDDRVLAQAYAAADLLLAPSRAESFGKQLAEALACGTPVVCFDATGPKDIVEHHVCGFKAKAFDAADLALGIDWVLGLDTASHTALRMAARQRALNLFDAQTVARRYLSLYQQLAADQPPEGMPEGVPERVENTMNR